MNNIFKIPAFQRRKAIPKQLKDLELLPLNEQFSKLTMSIVGDDDLRPVMTGNFFDMEKKKIVSTDAHKLTAINMPNETFDFIAEKYNEKLKIEPKGLIFHTLSQIQKDYNNVVKKAGNNPITISFEKFVQLQEIQDGRYPNYEAVFPKDFTNEINVDYQKLYWYAKVLLDAKVIDDATKINTSNANEYQNKKIEYLKDSYVSFLPYTKQIILTYTLDGKQEYIGFNARLVCEILKFAMDFNGKTFGKVGISGNNRGMVVELENGLNVINDSVGLLMPIFLQSGQFDNTIGDSDFDLSVAMYYDLDTNSIISDKENYPINESIGFMPNKAGLSTPNIRVKEEVLKVENSSADLIDKKIRGLMIALKVAKQGTEKGDEKLIEKKIKGLEIAKRMKKDDLPFSKGGNIGFKGLSNKVASNYEGKKVPQRFQSIYGKTYSESEAQEVGNKVAGKVYREQQANKMADGGMVTYDINWEDENGDEYSESFDTIEEVNDLIKNIQKNGGRIIEKLKYIGDDFKGYFENGGGVIWDKDSDSIRTELGEFKVRITPQMQKGYYDVYVSANKKEIGKKYDVYGIDNAKDIALEIISNSNKFAKGGGIYDYEKNKIESDAQLIINSLNELQNGYIITSKDLYINKDGFILVVSEWEQGVDLSAYDTSDNGATSQEISIAIANTKNKRNYLYKITLDEYDAGGDDEYVKDMVRQFNFVIYDTNNKKMAKGGMVEYFDYKDVEILYEPTYEEYFVNDLVFNTLEKAKKYIDSGEANETPIYIENLYRRGAMAKGGSVDEDISWDIFIRDEYDAENFEINVKGYFENEEDAIKQAIKDYDIYVDESDYGKMYWNGNEITIYGAKKNYKKGGEVGEYAKGGEMSFSASEQQNWSKKKSFMYDLYVSHSNDLVDLKEHLKKAKNRKDTNEVKRLNIKKRNLEYSINYIKDKFSNYAKGGEIKINDNITIKGNKVMANSTDGLYNAGTINEWFEDTKKEVQSILNDKDENGEILYKRIAESDNFIYYTLDFEDFNNAKYKISDVLDYYAVHKASGRGGDWEIWNGLSFMPLQDEFKYGKLNYQHPSLKRLMKQDSYYKNQVSYYKNNEKFDNGGIIDLFEDYENIPAEVQMILDEYSESFEDGDYIGMSKAKDELEQIGYTFNYYVSGDAYGLRPTNIKLSQIQGYEDEDEDFDKGGEVADEQVYIDYMNKEKDFKQDRIYFNTYAEAVEWGKKNFERFNNDMINYI